MSGGTWTLRLGVSDGGLLCASRRAAVVYAPVLVPLKALDCGFSSCDVPGCSACVFFFSLVAWIAARTQPVLVTGVAHS